MTIRLPQTFRLPVVIAAALGLSFPAAGAEPTFTVRKDIVFAEVDGRKLAFDLYLPKEAKRPPLIVWVHGGAWRAGSKDDMPLEKLVAEGFAIASVDYRLSTVAQFPAQAHDLKAAIRFLRQNAAELGFNPKQIAIAGGSAGGHLAALVGVTNGQKELEGRTGVTGVSSDVQAIVSFYGGSDLTTILQQSTPHGLKVRVPALQLLLGGQPDEKPALARLASPVFHVDAHDPPLFLLHGDADPQMPIEQARELNEAYKKAGMRVQFEVLPGAVHGGKEFYDAKRLGMVGKFLKSVLK